MNENTGKDAAAVRFPPPFVPLILVLAGVGLDWLWPVDPGFAMPAIWRYVIGGAIIVGGIAVLIGWPFVLFRRTGQDPEPWKPTPEIVEEGPYRFTRNPMYLQMVIGCIGFAVLLWNVWILLLTPVCALILQKIAIEHEEAYLEAKFGQPYLDYKARVRRWL